MEVSIIYIDTDLKLLFEKDKYVEVEKVSSGAFNSKFIVAIDKVTGHGSNFKHQKLYGVISATGNEILECKYSSIKYNSKTDTFDTEL